ncbi:MAG: acetate/propionate family kinase [Nitrospiraceae bacterium]
MTLTTDRRSHAGILAINAGSSSIKFALFGSEPALARLLSGKIERIGLPGTALTMTDGTSGRTERSAVHAPDHTACVLLLMERLERKTSVSALSAIGHRMVHGGMQYSDPQWISSDMLEALRQISPFDPDHLPVAIALIEAFGKRHPNVPQAACFDTAFHREMPRVAKLIPIPRRYAAMGIQRYGFHGLSYAFLMEELARVAGPEAARGRVVLAHLGNGASVAAVRGGTSIDTTMGFTPTSGLPMSTRSGDLDPGCVIYLLKTQDMDIDQFHDLVNARSGLLGVSEISPDLRDLLERESRDVRAAEAVSLFCYQVKKSIGAFAAALGGLDSLVFSGGIGEHAAIIRARICDGLDFLGIDLDATRNRADAPIVTKEGSRATVRVIRTDEELQIARSIVKLLADQAVASELDET